MKSLKKIICPNPTHKRYGHEKILCIYKEEDGIPVKFWFPCKGRKCRQWTQVAFNKAGVPQVETMPENVKFYDLDKIPVLVIDKYGKSNI